MSSLHPYFSEAGMVTLTYRLVNASNAKVPRSPQADCLTATRMIALNHYHDVDPTMPIGVIERVTLSDVFYSPPKAASKHRVSILRCTHKIDNPVH